MKFLIRQELIVLAVLGFGMVGCSEMDFTPSDKLLSKKDVVSESFTAKGDYSDKKVDVLVVVDNSFSMAAEQAKMGDRLDSFISSLNGVDWQIGITTTDVSNGRHGIQGSLVPLEGTSGNILSSRISNYEQVFKDTITRDETLVCDPDLEGDCPSGDEQPLRAIMLATDKQDTDNAGFFRDGSDLAIIVLSDEDEFSKGHVHFPQATMPSEVTDHLDAAFPDKTKTAFGIITPVGDEACRIKNVLEPDIYSTHVDGLVDLTGGVVGSICDDDYAKSLTQIGKRVLQLMNHVILRLDPDPETLEVRFVPVVDAEYRLDGRKLIFSKPIPENTKINVIYRQVGWDFDLTDEERAQQL